MTYRSIDLYDIVVGLGKSEYYQNYIETMHYRSIDLNDIVNELGKLEY